MPAFRASAGRVCRSGAVSRGADRRRWLRPGSAATFKSARRTRDRLRLGEARFTFAPRSRDARETRRARDATGARRDWRETRRARNATGARATRAKRAASTKHAGAPRQRGEARAIPRRTNNKIVTAVDFTGHVSSARASRSRGSLRKHGVVRAGGALAALRRADGENRVAVGERARSGAQRGAETRV